MAIFILITAGVIAAFLVMLMATRTTCSVSFCNTRLKISLAIIGCGLQYRSDHNKIGVFCGRWIHYFRLGPRRQAKKKIRKTERRRQDKPKPKRRFPLSALIKIAKAAILFAAGFLSRVEYDQGRLDIQPVIANPALAGMMYGWGQALNGAFPRMRRALNFAPAYGFGKSSLSGQIVFSIKNRQMTVLIWRFLCDLPIKEIIRYRFFKKR